MENYTKGEVKEIDDPYPFNLDDRLQMRITKGSKIRNVMAYAMRKMSDNEVRQIAWNGSGQSLTKAITCAEIMKRKLQNLHQITKIRFKRTEEHWIPKVEGLEPLKVNTDIAAISILLSKDPLDTAEPGYQPPGSLEAYWQEQRQAVSLSGKSKSGRRQPRPKKYGSQQDPKEGTPQRRRKMKEAHSASNADSKTGET